MIYSLSLWYAVILTGLLLLALGGAALAQPAAAQRWLRAFPRSRGWGTALLLAAAAWSWLLIKNIDLGEFSNWRDRLLILIPVAAFLTWKFVDELLSARALGMLVLLAAEPLLEAAFLRPEASRLWLVSFVYLAILAAMFWIGMPYVLRDQIGWITKSESRWRAAAFAGIGYGAVLLICLSQIPRHSS